jgi:hypothetical protein
MSKIVFSCALIAGAALSSAASAGNQVPAPYQVPPGSPERTCALGAAAYAQVYLTNAGLFDQKKVDSDRTDVVLLAKKPLRAGAWESVYFMTLHQHDGKSIDIVTVSTNTADECAVEDVKTYVVSHQLGKLPEQADLSAPAGHASGK